MSQNSAIALQIVLADPASGTDRPPDGAVHPQAQALVADELHDTDRFIDGCVLGFIPVQFVLGDQHGSCPFVCFLLY